MARSFEPDQYASCHVVTQHPVPNWWSASLIVRLSEHVLRVMETIRFRYSDGQPDDVEQEVKYDEVSRSAEYRFVCLGIKVVESESDEQENL